MVNNAGLGGTALVEMTDEQWSVLDVTLNGTFRMHARRAAAHVRPRGAGVIVNNASVLGWRAQEGQAHYAAAKAGVMALTRCAAIEAAEHGVRVNAVAPSLAMHPNLAKVTTEGCSTSWRAPRRSAAAPSRGRSPTSWSSSPATCHVHDRRGRAGVEPAPLSGRERRVRGVIRSTVEARQQVRKVVGDT